MQNVLKWVKNTLEKADKSMGVHYARVPIKRLRKIKIALEATAPDGDEVVISKQSLKDLLFLSRHYETRGIYDREAKEKFAAAVAEAKGKLGDHGDTNAG